MPILFEGLLFADAISKFFVYITWYIKINISYYKTYADLILNFLCYFGRYTQSNHKINFERFSHVTKSKPSDKKQNKKSLL